MLIVVIIIILIIILFLIYIKNKKIESFDNLESNLYTYDTCCSQDQIKNCESYGKTGVCNYYKNNKSCMCQNSF
jgi:septation ring formation regulator EzrA